MNELHVLKEVILMKTLLAVLFGACLAWAALHTLDFEQYLNRRAQLEVTQVDLELHQALCVHGEIAVCKPK